MLRQRGFSLVELMIGMALGLMLLAMLLSIYLSVKQTYTVQDNLARMQENARLALRLISHDVRMAGYWGDSVQYWTLQESGAAPLGAVGGECYPGWAHVPALPGDHLAAPAVVGSNGDRTAFAGCIDANEFITGSDAMALHFAEANAVANSAIEAGKVYLRSALLSGLLFKARTDKTLPVDVAAISDASSYRISAVTYYLRPWSIVAPTKARPKGDDIPTLMRATLSDCGASACVKSDALVEGIADLQIQFRLDPDSGAAFLNAEQVGDITTPAGKQRWRQVRALRVGLLARSLVPEANYVDGNAPYHLGDQSVSPAGDFRNFWITSTIALRNSAQPGP